MDLIFFEKTFYQELVSSFCIGAYFESSVKFLGLPLSTSKTLCEIQDLTGYAHGISCPSIHISLCKVSLTHPS